MVTVVYRNRELSSLITSNHLLRSLMKLIVKRWEGQIVCEIVKFIGNNLSSIQGRLDKCWVGFINIYQRHHIRYRVEGIKATVEIIKAITTMLARIVKTIPQTRQIKTSFIRCRWDLNSTIIGAT